MIKHAVCSERTGGNEQQEMHALPLHQALLFGANGHCMETTQTGTGRTDILFDALKRSQLAHQISGYNAINVQVLPHIN